MAGGERPDSIGPMVANDELVANWINNLDLFEGEGRELVVTRYRFETVGPKTIALIIPKKSDLDLFTVLPGEKVMRFETTTGSVSVNPEVLTDEQAKRLLETRRVRQTRIQFSDKDLKELEKTFKAND